MTTRRSGVLLAVALVGLLFAPDRRFRPDARPRAQGRDDSGALGDIERIRGARTRMRQLIDSMLRMARQTRGPAARQAVDLSAIARETVDLLSAASRRSVACA